MCTQRSFEDSIPNREPTNIVDQVSRRWLLLKKIERNAIMVQCRIVGIRIPLVDTILQGSSAAGAKASGGRNLSHRVCIHVVGIYG